MTNDEVQDYLYQHIPLSRAMGIEVTHAQKQKVVLSIPLEPNINHRETAFGGSISAAATLACWILLHLRLLDVPGDFRLVIHKNKVVYRSPIKGRFSAVCHLTEEKRWSDFLSMLDRWGKAKMMLKSHLEYEGIQAGEFSGSFVALRA
ncbi:MAG: thioesterase domain-containing protein [Planctomycetes bacterium]|nr:thioesterase domain-containing protein [Planctomycetota bacterium]